MNRRGGAIAVSAGIFLSRIAGLLREAVVRGRLGLGVASSAYTAALRIPNLLQNLLGEGVLSASFIPVYSGLVDDEPEQAGKLAGAVASFLVLVTIPLVLIGVLLAEPITRALQFGVADESLDLTVDLVRIMTPGVGVLVLSAWSLGVLNSHRRFFLAYAAPVIWNVTQIAVVVAAGVGVIDRDIAVRVAWAVTIGAIGQFVVQLPAVRRANPHIRPSLAFSTLEFRDFVGRLGPVIIGRGSAQISAFIDLALAGLLTVNALGAVGAAQVLYLAPISLFAMSVAAAELPELSREAGTEAVHDRLHEGLMRIGFLVTFTSITYLLAGRRIVAAVFTLLPRSSLDSDDVYLIALVLGTYTLGLLAVSTSRLMQTVFYAEGDTRTPARAAIWRFSVAAVIAVITMFQFEQLFVYDGAITGFDRLLSPLTPVASALRENVAAPNRLGAMGLGLGATVGAWLEFTLLRTKLARRLNRHSLTDGDWRRLIKPAVGAAITMWLLLLLTTSVPTGLDVVVSVGPAGLVYVYLGSRNQVQEARRWAKVLTSR